MRFKRIRSSENFEIHYEQIPNKIANDLFIEWGHWLGACKRPCGMQSFGLFLGEHIVSVAVSASTVRGSCGGLDRKKVIELSRLCSHPKHTDLTRVCLKLWRKTAYRYWIYWPATHYVSYANSIKHKGDIYRFDGWKKIATTKAGVGSKKRGSKPYDAKTVWAFELNMT